MTIKTELLKADIEYHMDKIRKAQQRIRHEKLTIHRHFEKIRQIRGVINNGQTKTSIK